MATSLNAPLTGEMWHLSIDDLLEPLPETPRLGGPGPFVINLSASSAPIGPPAKRLTEFTATAHVYQIQRTEDRRPRYRLRLGPFLTEDEADALLAGVREIYPSALTATAESDDLRAISSLQARAEALATGRHAKRTTVPRPAAAPAAPANQSPPSPQREAVPAALTAAAAPLLACQLPQPLAIPVLSDTVSLVRRPPARATAPRAVPPGTHAPRPVPVITHKVIPTITHKPAPTINEEIEFAPTQMKLAAAPASTAPETAAPPPLQPTAPPAVGPRAPATAKRVAPPAIQLAGPAPVGPTAPAPVQPAAKPAAPAVAKPAVPVPVRAAGAATGAVGPVPQGPAPVPLKPTPIPPSARRVEALNQPLPNLESTQTLRPLTQLELQDDSVARWFAIQLSLAEQGFDPDSLPNLDIFGEYRLYSVLGTDQGKVMHALRLGFFAEESAAAAVASYLSGFYEKPTVKRISTAERERFNNQRVEARMDVGATGKHAVIEITSERVVREKRTTATVTPMPARPAGAADTRRN